MTFPISPGVYPREVDQSFIVPTAANSIGAIVVHSPKGDTDKVTLITNTKQFIDEFGSPQPDEPSMYSALAFLEKANRLNVIRVINDAVVATVDVVDGSATTVMTVDAKNAGVWGNSTTVAVTAPDGNGDFTVTVTVGGVDVETFTCSRTTTAKDGFGRSKYVEDVVNGVSDYIKITDTAEVGPHVALTATALSAGADDTSGVSDAQVNTAWDFFAVKEDIEISLLINAGWDTETVQIKMIQICEARQDCFAILDVPDTETTVANMVTYVTTTLNQNTSYAGIYAGWPLVYDQFNDKQLYVPPSGYVAGVYAETAEVSEVWFAPAGARRGILNVLGVKNVFTEGERDTLYTANINPIQNFIGEGIQVYGQKTLQTAASATDRVNVRLLLISLTKSLERATRPFVFEFNDTFTRENIKSIYDQFLDDIKARRGVTDFLVVVDETNNTALVIDQNKMIVDVFVKPSRSAEFIRINTIISPTGAVFTSG